MVDVSSSTSASSLSLSLTNNAFRSNGALSTIVGFRFLAKMPFSALSVGEVGLELHFELMADLVDVNVVLVPIAD